MRSMWKCVLGLCVGLAGLGLLVGNAEAQFKNGSQPTELNIPRVSQRGSVTQRIGLTDITINYHRPAVGGRSDGSLSSGAPTSLANSPARMSELKSETTNSLSCSRFDISNIKINRCYVRFDM